MKSAWHDCHKNNESFKNKRNFFVLYILHAHLVGEVCDSNTSYRSCTQDLRLLPMITMLKKKSLMTGGRCRGLATDGKYLTPTPLCITVVHLMWNEKCTNYTKRRGIKWMAFFLKVLEWQRWILIRQTWQSKHFQSKISLFESCEGRTDFVKIFNWKYQKIKKGKQIDKSSNSEIQPLQLFKWQTDMWQQTE